MLCWVPCNGARTFYCHGGTLQFNFNLHFQAPSINRPPLYIWLKLLQRTPVGMCRDGNCGEVLQLPSKCYVTAQQRGYAVTLLLVAEYLRGSCVAMAARYPHCTVLMWLHGAVRRRYVAAMVCREEESGRVFFTTSYFADNYRITIDLHTTGFVSL